MDFRQANWWRGLQAYVAVSAAAHLVWEILQLPLYTIWASGTTRELAFAVVHCTAGDVLIALAALSVSLIVVGSKNWPGERYWQVTLVTVALGLGYTVYSEWLNVAVRGNWAYAPAMPVVPLVGTGLSPLLQWVIVPALALAGARTAALRPDGTG